MIAFARRYLALGLSVFPVGTDKHPHIAWKPYQTQQPTASELAEWWEHWPAANIGCATGSVSGLVVLDADTPSALEDLKTLLPQGFTTWRSRTGRDGGGWQLFFSHPGNGGIQNRAGLRPGLDVRGDGGYVILPPSVHASGRAYAWEVSPKDAALAPLPAPLITLLAQPETPPLNSNGAAPGAITQGHRNAELHRLARSLYAKGLAAPEVLAAIEAINRDRCQPPMPIGEVRQLVAHAGTEPHRADFGRAPVPPWNSSLVEVRKVGLDYAVQAGTVHMIFRSVTPHHDGPTAIVESLDHAIGGRPHIDRLSLLSSRTRESLAKTLAARWPGHQWSNILDDAAIEIYRDTVAGSPPELLTAEKPARDAWLVEDFIPLDQTTVLYADGGSMKSYFAAALGIAALRNEPLAPSAAWCVAQARTVLYLDWETDKRTHQHRLWRLLRGLNLPPDELDGRFYYMRMVGRPLLASHQGLMAQATRIGADLILVDSLGGASGGGDGIETAAAIPTLAAIGALPGTKLVLHHITNASASAGNVPTRPYGSTYIRNLARSAIEARAEPDGHDTLVTYHHRKANDAPLHHPLAIRYAFDRLTDSLTLYSATPDLQHAALPDKILSALAQGQKSVAGLAEILDHSQATIRSALHRLEKRGKCVADDTEGSGRGKFSLWRLGDTSRGTLGD